VSLSEQFSVKNEALSVEFTFLIVAVIEKVSVEYTEWISSLSAIQYTVEKSDFKLFAATDRNSFCGTTSNFVQNSIWNNTFGELNW